MQNDKNPFMPFCRGLRGRGRSLSRKYRKEILDSPRATPIREIAQKQMNLDIVDTESFSPDDSIQELSLLPRESLMFMTGHRRNTSAMR